MLLLAGLFNSNLAAKYDKPDTKPYVVLCRRETENGSRLILTTSEGKKKTIPATADVTISSHRPDYNYQNKFQQTRLLRGARC